MKQVARLVSSVGIRNSAMRASRVSRIGAISSMRSYATAEAFPKISAQQMYWTIRTGQPVILLDARPADKYRGYHIEAFVNYPAETTQQSAFAGMPVDRNVFVMADYPNLAGAEKIAAMAKASGAQNVYIVDGSCDLVKDAGFFYYYDDQYEQARIAKEKADALAAQQAAAAAAAAAKK